MFVGSITDFGNTIIDGIESVKAFCSKVKSNAVETWNKVYKIANTEIRFDGLKETLQRDITSFFPTDTGKGIVKMSKMDPHTEIKPMFTEALAALDADLAAYAA